MITWLYAYLVIFASVLSTVAILGLVGSFLFLILADSNAVDKPSILIATRDLSNAFLWLVGVPLEIATVVFTRLRSIDMRLLVFLLLSALVTYRTGETLEFIDHAYRAGVWLFYGVLYDVLLAVDFVWSTTVPVYNAFFLLIKQLAMSLFDQIVYCDKEVLSYVIDAGTCVCGGFAVPLQQCLGSALAFMSR